MPTTLDATVGGASSNSYLSLGAFAARADDSALHAAYTAASPDDRTRALLQATARLDLEPFAGTRATTTQQRAWPRAYVPDPDRRLDYAAFGGRDPLGFPQAIDSTIVPERILTACAELALQLLSGASLSASDDLRDVVREKVGPLETEYAAASLRAPADALSRWPSVWRAIAPLLASGAGSASQSIGRVVRA